jgi:hypothetical protein
MQKLLKDHLVVLCATAFTLTFALASCLTAKQVARSANDIARDLCILHFGEKVGITPEQVAKKFCETQADLSPWLDAILAAKRGAAPIAEARKH